MKNVTLFLMLLMVAGGAQAAPHGKWIAGGSISASRAVTGADHSKWFELSPSLPGVVISLPDPFVIGEKAPVAGMTVVFELPDGAAFAPTFTPINAGQIMLPDGQIVSSWTPPVQTFLRDTHVFRFVAGNQASRVAWYVESDHVDSESESEFDFILSGRVVDVAQLPEPPPAWYIFLEREEPLFPGTLEYLDLRCEGTIVPACATLQFGDKVRLRGYINSNEPLSGQRLNVEIVEALEGVQ
jgi:hypothetical protein